MVAVIPLSDASRRPTRFPTVTACIIALNVAVFLLELSNGDPFVTHWSVIPADIVAGHRWITMLTAMFMHGSWSHIIANMVFLWAFGPEVEDSMSAPSYLRFYLAGGLVATLAQIAATPGLWWHQMANKSLPILVQKYMSAPSRCQKRNSHLRVCLCQMKK